MALSLLGTLLGPGPAGAEQAASATPPVMFVQASRVETKETPDTKAAKVGMLKRGDQVSIVQSKGSWVQVKAGQSTGWVSKVFLSPRKPVGQADLADDVGSSLEKTSRRRPSSYSMSAATRGLAEDEGNGSGAEPYKADFKALKRLENGNVPAREVEEFRDKAKLPK